MLLADPFDDRPSLFEFAERGDVHPHDPVCRTDGRLHAAEQILAAVYPKPGLPVSRSHEPDDPNVEREAEIIEPHPLSAINGGIGRSAALWTNRSDRFSYQPTKIAFFAGKPKSASPFCVLRPSAALRRRSGKGCRMPATAGRRAFVRSRSPGRPGGGCASVATGALYIRCPCRFRALRHARIGTAPRSHGDVRLWSDGKGRWLCRDYQWHSIARSIRRTSIDPSGHTSTAARSN